MRATRVFMGAMLYVASGCVEASYTFNPHCQPGDPECDPNVTFGTGGQTGTGGRAGTGGFVSSGTGGSFSGGGTGARGSGGADPSAGGTSPGAGGSPVLGNCTVSMLDYSIVDADYSAALDRIVVVSSNPNRLHVVDGATKAETTVDLDHEPVAVSVAPDGSTAAVAHDGFVSWVDLQSHALKRTAILLSDAHDIMMGSAGDAYVIPKTDQWVDVHSVDLNSGTDKTQSGTAPVYAGSVGLLNSRLGVLYAAMALSPSRAERYDVKNGLAKEAFRTGDPVCNGLWPSADSSRMYTGCGSVMRSSNTQSEDMTTIGQFFSAFDTAIRHLAERGPDVFLVRLNGSETGLEDTKVEVYSSQSYALETERDVPCIHTASRDVKAHARFVFPRSTGSTVFVLVQADAGSAVAGNWGIAVLD